MPDRIIRDELLGSLRWLDLPSDSHRLAFIGLVLIADDYGNIEGGSRRLYRWLTQFTQIKAEADSIKLLSDLADCDLIRRYEVENREYWHITRFKNSRRYWSRKYPKSPYQEETTIESNQQHTKNPSADLTQTCHSPSRGVGVGVGVGVKRSTPLAPRADAPDAEIAVMDYVIKIPLIGGAEFGVTKEFAAELESLYPAVDVNQTLREIRGWNFANDKNRKTAAGIKKHINSWFSREQNRG